jgi:hypothetical protein
MVSDCNLYVTYNMTNMILDPDGSSLKTRVHICNGSESM